MRFTSFLGECCLNRAIFACIPLETMYSNRGSLRLGDAQPQQARFDGFVARYGSGGQFDVSQYAIWEKAKQMKNSRWTLRTLGLLLLWAITAQASDKPALKFGFTKANVPGAIQTQPWGINNAGIVVGTYINASNVTHGYMLDGKTLTEIDDPKAAAGVTFPYGINPGGPVSVVGVYASSETGLYVGFLYKDGEFTDIPGPSGAIETIADGINDNGAIVGYYIYIDAMSNTAQIAGFLLQDGEYTTLNVPGGYGSSYAYSINESGQIVLLWFDSNNHGQGSLYDSKTETYATVKVPGAVQSQPQGINAAGDVVFRWFDAINISHGALLHNGKYYTYDFPNGTGGTYSEGINDIGDIVGFYWADLTVSVFQGFKAHYESRAIKTD
jgi:uncharacterized membrane protein